MPPTHIDERLLDRVIVAPPRRGVDVVMFPRHPAYPKVDGSATEEPVLDSRPSECRVQTPYRLYLFRS
jgi:hypothetical protein